MSVNKPQILDIEPGVAELGYEIEKSMISNSYSLRLCASA